MKKLFLLLVAVLSVALCSSAQTRIVTGTVLEEGTDEPVIGASVYAGKSSQGVATDVDGNFRISVPAGVNTLRVHFVGYKETTQTIPASNKITVYLKSDATVLDEAIVVAYGTAKRSEYTGSAAVVKGEALENTLTSNVTNALTGKMAGVQTLNSNGQPGTSSTVLIRGVGSINAGTSPLYVVDGMPFDGDIATIANSDIESLTVLKDAASAALYGARGANGVILITTRKGHEGQAKVTVDMRWGANTRALPNYDVIKDSREYIEMVYRVHKQTAQSFYEMTDAAAIHKYANDNIWKSIGYQTWTVPAGQDIVGTDGKFNPYATPGYASGNFYFLADDWTKNTLSNGLRQEYNLSISGGTGKFNYYVSGSYLDDEGIISNSHFQRFSTRANVDYQAKPWLKIGTNMAYTYTNSGYPDGQINTDGSIGSDNAFALVNVLAPVYPMFIRYGQHVLDENGNDLFGTIAMNPTYNRPIYDYGTSSTNIEGFGRTPSRNTLSSANPASDLIYNREDYLADVFDAKWYAIINPLEGLNITGTAGYTLDNSRLHYLANRLYGQSEAYKGQVQQSATRYRTINLQALASYNKTFAEKHNMDLMVGFENQAYQVEGVWAIASNIYQPDVFVVDNGIDDIRGGGNQSNLVHRGFFGRAKYTYDGRYFFMGSIRRDGSSRFAPNHRWGTFWSLSAGWDIAQEQFMKNVTWVDLLKFKFSFGQNGNDVVGNSTTYMAYTDFYRITGADGVWSDGTLAGKGNPDITWETSNNLNTGFDFSLFNRKLEGSIEYFQRQTKDMLFSIPTAPSLGYSSMPMNVGSMRNSGVEIDLNYNIINTKNITWNVNANVTFGWNKVLKLDNRILNRNVDSWNPDSKKGWLRGSRIFFEGKSMYNLFLVDYAGVNHENGDALYWSVTSDKDKAAAAPSYSYDVPNYRELGTVQEADLAPDGSKQYDENGNLITKPVTYYEYQTPDYTEAYNTNRKETGNLMPKGYGGFGTDFQAYGFEVQLAFSYQFGGKIIDSAYQGFMMPGTTGEIGQNFHRDMLGAWSQENPTSDIPRLAAESKYSASNMTSTRFLTSSNYLALNNVTVGYNLPKKWTSKMLLEGVKIYFSAENVALWSKRKGLDPRQDFTSSNNQTYSPIRSLAGGIKVTF